MSQVLKHFVAYHKVDERGALRSDKDGSGEFETNKAAKPRKGDVLWCIEGEGSPKKYRLATRGVVTRLTKHPDGTSIVHYMGPVRFERIDRRWDEACAVTKCSVRDLLRASHIKPWRVSSHQERLDPQNGILLSANIDILFDKGFLSFDDNGHMLVSARLSASDQRRLGLPKNLIRKPDPGECAYLKHHRKALKL
jgi:hypothetical protein